MTIPRIFKHAMHRSFRAIGFDIVQMRNLDAALKARERQREAEHLLAIGRIRLQSKAAIPAAARDASPQWVPANEL